MRWEERKGNKENVKHYGVRMQNFVLEMKFLLEALVWEKLHGKSMMKHRLG